MNGLTRKIGLSASFTGALSFLIFTVCFVAIVVTQDVSEWKSLEDYLVRTKNNSQFYKQTAQVCSVIFGASYLVIVNCLAEVVNSPRQILQKLSVSFGTIFTALIGINYFLQLTAVQFNIQAGSTDEIANWIMFNPNSISLSIAMLGWTFMFGISSLCAAPIFEGKGIRKTIRVLLFLNGIFCISGGLGFLLQKKNLVNLTINMGMGGTMTVLTIVLTIFF